MHSSFDAPILRAWERFPLHSSFDAPILRAWERFPWHSCICLHSSLELRVEVPFARCRAWSRELKYPLRVLPRWELRCRRCRCRVRSSRCRAAPTILSASLLSVLHVLLSFSCSLSVVRCVLLEVQCSFFDLLYSWERYAGRNASPFGVSAPR